LIAWGDKDPWEPIDNGRNYESFDSVEDFIVLPNVGHCPQVLSLSLSIVFMPLLAPICNDYFHFPSWLS